MKVIVYMEMPDDMHGSYMQPQGGAIVPDAEWEALDDAQRRARALAILADYVEWGYKAVPDSTEQAPRWRY